MNWHNRIQFGVWALGVCYLSSLLPLLGVYFGACHLPRQPAPRPSPPGFLSALRAWDGTWYEMIVRDGYFYDPDKHSSVAFFPAYPTTVSLLHNATGMPIPWSLVIVSNGCLLGAFVLFGFYLQPPESTDLAPETDWSLLALGLWPLTFFFRMAYSESLFLLVMLTAMLGMKRRWHPLPIALAVGLATACRPVGGALVPVFLFYLWQRTAGQNYRFADWLWRAVLLGPIACWGLVAYMIYLQIEFQEPLAFAETQERWHVRPTEPPLRHLQALLTAEPIWSCYLPQNKAYWAEYERRPDPLCSLQFANPIFFVATAGLVILGGWRGWLDRPELLLSAGLLLIPYVTHSYQTIMMGQGRYSASVFPLYIVLGKLLHRMPPPLAGLCCGFSVVFLVMYSALFAAWYRVF